ncbi:MAG: polysaccharide export protein [Alphaproteobacteria bacterium]|nr:polysaccharide export protein [Alphaproteobacteria bacterium]
MARQIRRIFPCSTWARYIPNKAVLCLIASFLVIGGMVGGSSYAADVPAYKLGSGDQVKVVVFGQKDLSGEFTVDGSGNISMPLIGNVRVGSASLRQAETAIIGKLKPDYLKKPRVSVEVLNYRPFYIIGEVKKPGSYPFVNGMTVINAVALGGGYTYRARENNIFITRGNDPGRQKQKANHETVVLPGDVIEVPERFF